MHELVSETDRRIAECKQRIEGQRRRIFELERMGDDTAASVRLLETLIQSLSILEMRRDTVLRRAHPDRGTERQTARIWATADRT